MTKFVEGAWVVVVAIPLLILLFNRIEAYYSRSAQELGVGTTQPPLHRKRTIVLVPVTSVSRMTHHTLTEAISLGDDVLAVTVVIDGVPAQDRPPDVEAQWREWDPGVPLRVLHTEYASIVEPILGVVDELRMQGDRQVVVLIPVVIPEHFRYRLLHNQVDLALTAQLHRRPDVVVARVPLPIRTPEGTGTLAD